MALRAPRSTIGSPFLTSTVGACETAAKPTSRLYGCCRSTSDRPQRYVILTHATADLLITGRMLVRCLQRPRHASARDMIYLSHLDPDGQVDMFGGMAQHEDDVSGPGLCMIDTPYVPALHHVRAGRQSRSADSYTLRYGICAGEW